MRVFVFNVYFYRNFQKLINSTIGESAYMYTINKSNQNNVKFYCAHNENTKMKNI